MAQSLLEGTKLRLVFEAGWTKKEIHSLKHKKSRPLPYDKGRLSLSYKRFQYKKVLVFADAFYISR
ncbi:hypothetical protein ACFVSW_21555 [Neobacillus sp. NPDC058068]|uniref:hypothetical protein n=1 Tax=Neobacillus sp. NPDC058068 TaxID=3346325 RepID=UPI0036DB898C